MSLLANHPLRFELTKTDPHKVIQIPVRQLGIKKVVIVRKGEPNNVSTLQRTRKRDYFYRIQDVLPIRKMPRVSRERRIMNDLLLLVMSGWAIAAFVGSLVAHIVYDILKALARAIKRGLKNYGR